MNFSIDLPDVVTGQVRGGESQVDFGELEALNKALTTGYGTDVSTFTGGTALRIQSLDKTMKSTIVENEHFRLFNALMKSSATATVDEWTERNGIGGFLGSTTNTETGIIAQAQGSYQRRVGLVKYLMTRCEVSLVSTLGNNLASSEATEGQNGTLRLLQDSEFLCFEGNSAACPTEFDGIGPQMFAGVADGSVDGSNVLDAGGSALASINLINTAAATISGFGNFGTPTHIFLSQLCQADFDTGLDPAFRVPLTDVPGGGVSLGAPVNGIRTSWGNIKNMPDVFVRDEAQLKPFQVDQGALATTNTGLKPTLSIALASDTASKFLTKHGGNYYYLVTGLNAAGQSDGVISSVQAVAAGQKATLTITRSSGAQETGYAIYRSQMGGDNSVANFRLMTRVACAGATTVYVDRNTDIPGTTKAYILNMKPGADAIAWRQLLPMLKFQLYPTNAATLPWAQLLFGFLRLAKRRQHVVIKNITTGGQVWKPFGTF